MTQVLLLIRKRAATKERIEHKKEDVKENRILIEDDYTEIINKFHSFLERINNLPTKRRVPFGIIHSKTKESKLHKLLYKFYSSRRLSSKEFNSIINAI